MLGRYDAGVGPFPGDSVHRKKAFPGKAGASRPAGCGASAAAAKAGVDVSATTTQANPVLAKKNERHGPPDDSDNATELWEDLCRTVRDL